MCLFLNFLVFQWCAIITERCSILNFFYKQIIHRRFAISEGEFCHLFIPYFLGKKNKFRLIFISNVHFIHGNLVHFLKDDWDFSNYFSLAFAVDLLVYYLDSEDFLLLENTEFQWVFFYWSAFHLSGLFLPWYFLMINIITPSCRINIAVTR